MALIVVMGVMTGFGEALTATIIGNRSHLVIRDHFGQPMADAAALMASVQAIAPEVVAAGPIIEVKGLLQTKSSRGQERYEGAFILGIDPERETGVTQLGDNMTREKGRTFGRGEMPGDKEIVLGYLLAMNLRAQVGDTIAAFT